MTSKQLNKWLSLFAVAVLSTASVAPTAVIVAEETVVQEEQPPAMPDGEAPAGEGPGGEGGGFGGANTMTYDYSGEPTATVMADGETVEKTDEELTSTTGVENVALAKNAGTLTLSGTTLTKSGDDDNDDNANFYGTNAIVLAVNEGSTINVSDSSLTADSLGSNAIFATDNATVLANNNTIATTNDNSRGLDATYGGTIIANKMTISTQGDHSATVATDRGGGSIALSNSSLETAGSGSPLLYSTGNIQVTNVTGTSTGSQIAGMEGLNTILIHQSDLTSTLTTATASDPIANGVILYQSTSGDAEASTGDTARFEVSESSLTSAIESGAMFYVTNTAVDILINDSTLDFDSSAANLLTVAGNDSNSWGTSGSNGGTVNMTASQQELSGNIEVDTISQLHFYVLDGSTYTGAMSITENAAATETQEQPLTVSVDATSKWVLTADTTISQLNLEEGGQIVDESGKTVTITANGETVVEGDSDLTLTVSSNYTTSVERVAANELSTDTIDTIAFEDYYGVSMDAKETADSSEEAATSETTEATETKESKVSSPRTSIIATATATIVAAIALVTYLVKRH